MGAAGLDTSPKNAENRRKTMVTVDRRTMLATGALALAGAAAQAGGAEAQAGPKPIFPVL
jgi:hypothetical protein